MVAGRHQTGLALSPCMRYLAAGGEDGQLTTYDTRQVRPLSGSLWLSLALSSSPWLSLARSSSLWVTLTLSGSLWLSLARSPALWEGDYKREAGPTSHL